MLGEIVDLLAKAGPVVVDGVKALVMLLSSHDEPTKRAAMDAAMAAAEEELARRLHDRKAP